MAFLGNRDKDQNQTASGDSTGAFATSGGATGPAPQQPGTGGDTVPWVNIQNYLQANQGSQGTSNALRSKLGGALQEEKDELNTRTGALRSQADTNSAPPNFYGLDRTDAPGGGSRYFWNDNYINELGSLYNDSGSQSDAYNQKLQQHRNFMGQQYQGPKKGSFGYQPGVKNANVQDYYGDLQANDQDFYNSTLPEVYRQTAGGTFGSGQMALQQQLDLNNPHVLDARKDLAQDYTNFFSVGAPTAVQETNDYLGQAENKFNQTKEGVNTALNFMGNSRYNHLQSRAEQLNATRQKAAQNEAQRKAYYEAILNPLNQRLSSFPTLATGPLMDPSTSAEQTRLQGLVNQYQTEWAPNDFSQAFDVSNISGRDDDRRQYNAILDLLGHTGAVRPGSMPYQEDLLNTRANATYDMAEAAKIAEAALSGQTYTPAPIATGGLGQAPSYDPNQAPALTKPTYNPEVLPGYRYPY
jgi:hypothetical protein